MPIQIIVSQQGALPITVNFKALSDAPVTLEVQGSVWTQTANNMIGIQVAIDNAAVGKAQIFRIQPPHIVRSSPHMFRFNLLLANTP